jgi:hypothetical protein
VVEDPYTLPEPWLTHGVGPRLLSFERPACGLDPNWLCRELDWPAIPYTDVKHSISGWAQESVPKLFVQTV